MAARMLDRPVRVTLTRQQMFAVVGYRTPTIQRVRLGADPSGRLEALDHQVFEQTSTLFEFAEQTAAFSRVMYAAPNLRTRHRLVALDVPTPRWMRAPGEAPGSCAVESAMDELAEACGVDPIDLRPAAMSRPSNLRAVARSAAATWWPACARAPSASAGPAGTPDRASAGTGGG